MQLKTVTYTSRARLDLTNGDLNGITGLLLFDGSRYLQIIEGAEEAIDNLVERLRLDPRYSAFKSRGERRSEELSAS